MQLESLFSELEWVLGEYSMEERKQWRRDRFREWFLEEFQPGLPALVAAADAPALCEPAFNFSLREHLIGRGVFIVERNGKPGRSRM